MSNMSYCMFQNTLADLRDCYDAIDDACDSEEERKARRALIKLCCDIASEHSYEVEE